MMLSTFVVSNVDVGLLSPAAAVAEDEKVLSRAVEFKTGIFFVSFSGPMKFRRLTTVDIEYFVASVPTITR